MSAIVVDTPAPRAANQPFYLWMAGAFLLIAFGGFTPTYWAPVVSGKFQGAPIVHIHGMLLFAWTCFYFVQTLLVAKGRTLDHRAWGLAGIALFSVMMCSILVAECAVLARAEALGIGEAARRFAAVTLCGWPMMAVLFSLAIVSIRRPQSHKRFMVLLMIAMMTPAIARVFLTILASPGSRPVVPPPFVSIPPALVADLLLVAAITYDWRTLGRPHRVYVYGGLALVLQQILTVPFAATALWMSLAKSFQALAG